VLLDSLELDLGALWILDPKENLLRPASVLMRRPSAAQSQFTTESQRLSFRRGRSFPGGVWQERRSMWITELEEETQFERKELAAKAELRTALAFPIQSSEEFFGVLEFFNQRPLAQNETLMNMMSAIGSEIGQFVERRTAEEQLRRAHDELEMRVQERTADLKTANAKLQAAISERRQLEHELLEITEKERRRIGLDLHDDLGQKLSGIALMTKGLQLRLAKQKAGEAQEASRIHKLVQKAMSHASDLAHDLATLELKETDLRAALAELAERVKELFEISCRFNAEGSIPPLEPAVVGQLYKIAQEAVTNAIKHGKAKKVTISLTNGSQHVVLKVQNDGQPFPDLKSRSTGMGLRIMNYRASLIGAALEIKGVGVRGTLVTCSLPIEGKKV
jgi:signal transduction histidine kinase